MHLQLPVSVLVKVFVLMPPSVVSVAFSPGGASLPAIDRGCSRSAIVGLHRRFLVFALLLKTDVVGARVPREGARRAAGAAFLAPCY